MRKVHTLESVRQHFIESGCELLETKFKTTQTKMNYICKCGETKQVSYHGFINRKIGCKTCISLEIQKNKPKIIKRTIDYDTVYQEFKDVGCTLLSKEYVNNREPLEYICKCGALTEKTYNCFQYKKGCMKCTGTPKYTLDKVKTFFSDRDCVLLSENYLGISKALDYICSCKNTSKITLSNLLNGHRCRECRTYAREYTVESVRKAFEEIGYELHDDYTQFDQTMSYTCNNGHYGAISWRKFKAGKRCCETASSSKDSTPSSIEILTREQQTLQITNVSIEENIFNSGISNIVKSELLQEMNIEFTDNEQRMFVNNFYSYMNYHQTDDYVVDLDKIYVSLGFSRKDHCKRIIEKNFTEDSDYKKRLPLRGGSGGGSESEQIMLNIDTFKNLCMIARTEEAKQIRKYYIKLENINNKIIKKSIKNGQILFNQDQINNSNKLIEHFGNKKDVFYMFSFKYLQEWYAKFGIVGELREFHNRVVEHQKEFEDICFHLVMQCSNVYKIESEFKETALHSLNKAKIPKKSGGFHVEILKLSEIVTTENIKVAGNRILDPPPEYAEVGSSNSIEIEREKTKQEQERTKQMEIQLKILETKIKAGVFV